MVLIEWRLCVDHELFIICVVLILAEQVSER